MFGVIDRYIGKTISYAMMLTLFMLVSLSGVIKFVDQLRSTGKGTYDTLAAGYYTILSIPKDIEIFFPMAVLLGALLGLGLLAQRSELIVMQASGFSRLQITFSVMKTALPLVLLTMAIGEYVVPQSENFARNYRTGQMLGTVILPTSQASVWLKDEHDFIYIERIKNNQQINGVNIYHFDAQRRLMSVLYAASGRWDEKSKTWLLSQVDESDLSNPENIIGTQTLSREWKTSLTPDKLDIVAVDPNSLSIKGLYRYATYLKASSQNAGRYELNMWRKILQPLSAMVMLMMALSFIFGPLRSTPMGMRVFIGISFGFLFYALDQIFGPLSLVYGFPPPLGAVLPCIVFFAISVVFLVKRQ